MLQAAVSNLPVPVSGLAIQVDGTEPDTNRLREVRRIVRRLQDLSLLAPAGEDAVQVHRWTAEGLRGQMPADYRACCPRAGRWRLDEYRATGDIEHVFEAVRNFLDGHAFDEAGSLALELIKAMSQAGQTASAVVFAGEVLEDLPEEDGNFAPIADVEGQGNLALGFIQQALQRYQHLTALHEARAQAEPARADYQRDLSISIKQSRTRAGASRDHSPR